MVDKLITVSASLKALFNHSAILDMARENKFISRLRSLQPAQFVTALIQTLSCKDHANLADILRTMNTTQASQHYKPFHNQIKKPECTQFIQSMAEKAIQHLFIEPFKSELPEDLPFKSILIHDGSTLTLNPRLQDEFLGRFTKTSPAAIECHLTYDALTGMANHVVLEADKESEKHFRPAVEGLKRSLVMLDAGYFDINYFDDINQNSGYFIARAKSNINPDVLEKFDEIGIQFAHTKMPLKTLKTNKNTLLDMTVKWKKTDSQFRIIQFYDRKTKNKGYLITNLDRKQFNGQKILNLYGLRWQIELFFKELKSFCSLKKVNTANPNIVKTLIWASILTVILKRYVAFSVSRIWSKSISSQKVCRSSTTWLRQLMDYVYSSNTDPMLLAEILGYIAENCLRSNLKRDEETVLFTSSWFYYCKINKLDEVVSKK